MPKQTRILYAETNAEAFIYRATCYVFKHKKAMEVTQKFPPPFQGSSACLRVIGSSRVKDPAQFSWMFSAPSGGL